MKSDPRFLPTHEIYASTSDAELKNLIEQYQRKERMNKIFPVKQVTKEKIKKTFPEISQSLQTALSQAHKINPANRKPLIDEAHEVINGSRLRIYGHN